MNLDLMVSKDLGTIGLVFLIAFVALIFLKIVKSILTKIFIALIIAGVFAVYLYFKSSL